jgi:zeta-carotene desaturase
LYGRIGGQNLIRWYDRLNFIEPGGRLSEIAASAWPAPFHTSPTFLRAHALSMRDKLAIARAMLAMMPARPSDNGQNFKQWLKAHGQTDRAISRFWEPVLVSALNEDADQLSVEMAGMVFRDAFLKSAEAGRMGLPNVPLSELYSLAGRYMEERGGRVCLRATIESIEPLASGARVRGRGLDGAESETFDHIVLAAPVFAVARLLPDGPEFAPIRDAAGHFEPSPITGIHLWFDREITELDHAVLLDRTIQWMFQKSRILSRFTSESGTARGSYLELVISSSRSLVEKSRQEIIDLAMRELADFFPIVREAKLVKATVVKEVHATFSPRPGIEQFRPQPATADPRVYLAGDWIATGWPATMEGAVRSGYMAAEALLKTSGRPTTILVPDLPARGLMRLFS